MGWTTEEINTVPQQYNCQLLQHKVPVDQIENPELPTDAYVVMYQTKEETIYDLCRSSKMTNIFDLYYDRFGSGLLKIELGYGRKSPKLWGYTPPEKKKRRK
jgi:hypothetical protein